MVTPRGAPCLKRAKWAVVLVIVVLHPVLLRYLFPVFGEPCNLVVLIAPVVVTLMFGWRLGVVVTLVNVVVSGVMFRRLVGMGHQEGLPKGVVSALVAVAVCLGMDRLRRFIEQRRAMKEELQEARRLEAIGRLAGGVAHDMNNTLNAIMGSVFAHQQEIGSSGPASNDLDNIVAACERGAQLTQNLLGFAKKRHYKRQTFSLNGIAQSVQGLLIRTANKNIRIDTRLAPGPLLIEGDPGQVENAVINLCINALDAMSGQGTLTIATQGESGRVSIRVTDTGIGMDDNVKARAFEPFFTTKAEGKGTGLGLSLVYGVVHAMNGKIALDSTPGKGTSITLTFPEANATETEGGASRMPPEETDTLEYLRDFTVLLIDDEPMVLRSSERLLKVLGCQVLSASTGREGIEKFKACQGAIDLAIVDFVMPEMDGIATIEALLAIAPATPVLLVSGYARGSGEVEAFRKRRPTVGFLAKPYRPVQLIRAAKNLAIPTRRT